MNFGNSFCANSPAPLQQEIETHLNITDTEFNLFYSVKSLAGIISPLFTAVLYQKIGLRWMLYLTGVACAVGQGMVAAGLQRGDFSYCLIGRFVLGLSDA